jgi:hypothetical protein
VHALSSLRLQLLLPLAGVAQRGFPALPVRLPGVDLGVDGSQLFLQTLDLLLQIGKVGIQLAQATFPGRAAILQGRLQRLGFLLQPAAATHQFIKGNLGGSDSR